MKFNIQKETPPPVWGRRVIVTKHQFNEGNTPTCVGKTYQNHWYQKGIQKHPHLCGEDLPEGLIGKAGVETPPPVWGRQDQETLEQILLRNTPTCVGKTHLHHWRCGQQQKHPHLCGEDMKSTPGSTTSWETPPPVWGRQISEALRKVAVGNTPTCVGKTPIYC